MPHAGLGARRGAGRLTCFVGETEVGSSSAMGEVWSEEADLRRDGVRCEGDKGWRRRVGEGAADVLGVSTSGQASR